MRDWEIVKGEYLMWATSAYLVMLIPAFTFGIKGLLFGVGLFGLLGIILVNIKAMNPYLLRQNKSKPKRKKKEE